VGEQRRHGVAVERVDAQGATVDPSERSEPPERRGASAASRPSGGERESLREGLVASCPRGWHG
jgi:hypothetical protein